MASTAVGERLTDQHRRSLLRLRAMTTAQLLLLLRSFDPSDVDGTWPRLEPAITALVQDRRGDAIRLASNWYVEFRAAEGIRGTFPPVPTGPVRRDTLLSSLRVTGPVAFDRARRNGKTVAEATRLMSVQLAGSTTRHVLNGSRETVLGTVDRDPAAQGWYRKTGSKPCAFCAMLAGRGAIYRTQTTAGFHPHDNCACSPVPMYRTEAVPDFNRDLGDLWSEATRGVRGTKAQRNAFRRAYEAA